MTSTSRSVTTKVVTTTTVSKGGTGNVVKTTTITKEALKYMKDLIPKKSYPELLTELRGTGKLWEDENFPALTSSVFNSKSSKNYREFEWKRPHEICNDPKLFADGVSRFDVQQGALGDCWLLAVVASLSLFEPIFKNVVPSDQNFDKDYIGAFRFRFWRFGNWCEIIVDDRLPTYRGKLVFMHSADSKEFWSALLEKAYAKMCGTYEALNGGSQIEAMEDFTGGLCETIKLNEKERPADLYKNLLKFQKQCSLMGCAIESTKIEGILPNGLITGHAYSITMVQEVKLLDGSNMQLLRVRNPWGNEKEWKGKWSDNSAEWDTISKQDKDKLCSGFANDGEFWISYDDFITNFTKVEVCHLGPESLDTEVDGKKRWEMSIEEGSWCKNINAGGCRNFLDSFVTNPQFRIEVVDPDEEDDEDMSTLIIGLMQKDMRQKHLDFYVIGYVVYKLKDPNSGLLNKSFFKFSTSIAKSPGFVNMREVCGRHKLTPGHYVIVPSTFNPNEEASFMLRIYSQKPNKTNILDVMSGKIGISKHLTHMDDSLVSTVKNDKIIALEKELETLFKNMSGPLEMINACQLKDIVNACLIKDTKNFKGFDMEICRSMIALSDDDHTGKMEFNEFMTLVKNLRLWKTAFKEFDADENGVFDAYEFRNALNNIGLCVSNDLFKVVGNRFTDPELGVIRFEDFIMAAIRLTNAFETMEKQVKNDQGLYLFSHDEFMQSLLYM